MFVPVSSPRPRSIHLPIPSAVLGLGFAKAAFLFVNRYGRRPLPRGVGRAPPGNPWDRVVPRCRERKSLSRPGRVAPVEGRPTEGFDGITEGWLGLVVGWEGRAEGCAGLPAGCDGLVEGRVTSPGGFEGRDEGEEGLGEGCLSRPSAGLHWPLSRCCHCPSCPLR